MAASASHQHEEASRSERPLRQACQTGSPDHIVDTLPRRGDNAKQAARPTRMTTPDDDRNAKTALFHGACAACGARGHPRPLSRNFMGHGSQQAASDV
ncbi:hypothetical protein CSOJ01_10639 [Colletotrichum sojae]|uniref:Uncharacterized protein n=1 Tax=Colletotrichum sojae TaxID=2175907 RepID=A0A8H6J0D0_9PEZI|nr:hypothetical protein CSOJ01_10639 [Colletotrichum sojae]